MRKATGFDTRGGNDFRPSRKQYSETHGVSQTAAVLETAALRYDCSDVQETVETHLIPRKSLTEQLHLALFPRTIETEQTTTRQRDKLTGDLVTVTNNRQIWKSDRSLLIQGKPVDETRFKRETSRSKRRVTEIEEPATIEIPQTADLPQL